MTEPKNPSDPFAEGNTPTTDRYLAGEYREISDWRARIHALKIYARRLERRMRAAEAMLEELVGIIDGAVEDQATDRRFIDSLTTQPARRHLEAAKKEDA